MKAHLEVGFRHRTRGFRGIGASVSSPATTIAGNWPPPDGWALLFGLGSVCRRLWHFTAPAISGFMLLTGQLASSQTYPRIWQQVFPPAAPPTRNAAVAYDEARRVTVS